MLHLVDIALCLQLYAHCQAQTAQHKPSNPAGRVRRLKSGIGCYSYRMGMQDRDYYKEAWKKRDRGDIYGYHNGVSKQQAVLTALVPKVSPWVKVVFRYLYYVLLAALVLRLVMKVFSGNYF